MERKSMTRTLLKVMLPIAGQNLISAVVNAADVFMLSSMGPEALSAASLAGQVTFVLTLFYMGLGSGAGILAAQYWGRRDTDTIARVQALAMKLSMGVSALFFAAALVMPEGLMRLFTPEAEIMALGAGYLRAAAGGWLFMGLSQMMLFVFKSMERTREAALITVACLACNIVLNALAVFVLFAGQPALAVMGVAAATTISRMLECGLCLLIRRRDLGVPVHFAGAPRWLRRDYGRCTLPVQLNYLVWGCATAAASAVMGHVGSEMVSASSLAGTMRTLVTVGCAGLGSAGSILLGKALGAEDYELAKKLGRLVCRGSLVLGAAAGIVLIAFSPLCLRLSGFEGAGAQLLEGMLLISGVYCIGKSFNSAMVGGVFCAGGDTRFGLLCDTLAMWGVILPLALLSAFVWRWPPLAVYAVLSLDEFVKLPAVALRYRQGRWLNNLTRNEKERVQA